MSPQEVLVMAMTKMLTGVCTAGFSREPDPASGLRLRWVRPVKEHGSLLLGDLTDVDGRVIQIGDVIEFHLQKPRPNPPHVEDQVADFIFHRPRLLRRLEGERRAGFLAAHLDQAPQDILGRNPTRSLCLIRPERLWARFELDPYSLKYQARLGFTLADASHPQAGAPRGAPVTDVKWRALGRTWLGRGGGELLLGDGALRERLAASDIYLSLGLSRGYQDKLWLMVIGVHVVPDYQVEINYADL
jgi:hypothetical protein